MSVTFSFEVFHPCNPGNREPTFEAGFLLDA